MLLAPRPFPLQARGHFRSRPAGHQINQIAFLFLFFSNFSLGKNLQKSCMSFGMIFSLIFAFFTQNDPQMGDFSCFFGTPNRLKLQIAENAKTFIFLRKNMVFCMSGLPFWHQIFIKISTFFKQGFGSAF